MGAARGRGRRSGGLALVAGLALAAGAAGGQLHGGAMKKRGQLKHKGQTLKAKKDIAFRTKEAEERDKERARTFASDEPVPRGRPGKWNPGEFNSDGGKLKDSSTGVEYDLAALWDLQEEHERFFEFRGVKGGPRDLPHMYYDYYVGFGGFSEGSSLLPVPCASVVEAYTSNGGAAPSAFQMTAPRKAKGAGSQAEFEADEEETSCLALGSSEGWSFRMIDELTAEAGIQIQYTGGQECLKRVVTPRESQGKTKAGRTRKRMVTSWVPAPRNFTITLECGVSRQVGTKHDPQPGEMDALMYPIDSIEAQDFMQREVSATTGASVMETEMCNYELRWKTPYGCPVAIDGKYDSWRRAQRRELAKERFPPSPKDKATPKKKSAPSPRGGDRGSSRGRYGDQGHAGGEGRSWLGFFWVCIWKFLFWSVLCVVLAGGVQMYRKRSRMRLILPQLFEKNRRHRAVATKRFLSVMMGKDGRPSGRIV